MIRHLLSVFLLHFASANCPSGCNCDLNNKVVCSSTANSLPMNISNNVRVLELKLYSISEIPKNYFRELSNLKELWIKQTGLSIIREDSFDGLNLEKLYLELNKISHFDAGSFQNLTSLRTLSIIYNKNSTFPEKLFLGLSGLHELYLYSNELSKIPQGLFHGLSNLKILHLSGNKLTCLDENIFYGLSNLTQIRIDSNKLSYLKIPRLDMLEKILLRENNLKAIDIEVTGRLRVLNMYANELNCNCKLKNSSLWIPFVINNESNFILFAPLISV